MVFALSQAVKKSAIPPDVLAAAPFLSEQMSCLVAVKSIAGDGDARVLNLEIMEQDGHSVVYALRKGGDVMLIVENQRLSVRTGHPHIITHFSGKTRAVLGKLMTEYSAINITLIPKPDVDQAEHCN